MTDSSGSSLSSEASRRATRLGTPRADYGAPWAGSCTVIVPVASSKVRRPLMSGFGSWMGAANLAQVRST
jgi:hypothetical protein